MFLIRSQLGFALALVSLFTETAVTQNPPPPAARSAPVVGLILRDLPEFPRGKTSLLQGTVDPSGHRFLIENLDVLQPVSVTLVAAGPDQDLSLRLTKFGFDKPEREGSTLGEGIRQFRIRTQGDLRLLVKSREGQKPYQLIVWVGDPIEVPVPLLFIPAGGQPAVGGGAVPGRSGSVSTTALWAALAGLTIVVALLAFLVLRGKAGPRTGVVLMALGLGSARGAWAQCPPKCEPAPNVSVARIDPAQIWGKNPYAPNGYNPPPGPAGEKGWSPNPVEPTADIQPHPSAGPSAVAIPAGTDPAPAGSTQGAGGRTGTGPSIMLGAVAAALAVAVVLLGFLILRGKMGRKTTVVLIALGLGGIGTAGAQKPSGPSWWGVPNTSHALFEWYKATYKPLDPDDEDAWPEYDPPGVPSNCVTTKTPPIPPGTAKPIGAEGGQSAAYPCGQCFEEAHQEVGTVLQRFEKLRRITKATENMTQWALAFGDGASGIHGVVALGWHTQARPQITQAMENFYVTYDEKALELLAALGLGLQKVAVCEQQYFGLADWYERFGFMFYNTVAERHRR